MTIPYDFSGIFHCNTASYLPTFVLIFSAAVNLPLHPAPSTDGHPKVGVIIPLYIYPGEAWTRIAALRTANPMVPMVAIVNPANGPGSGPDPKYAAAISDLQETGVTVIGYVHTVYAAKALSVVESVMSQYNDWYGVDGIFLDEMSSAPANERYYLTLKAHADLLGFTCTIGNPGTDIPRTYVGTVDTFVIHEGHGLPDESFLAGWHSSYDKRNFAMIAYGVPSIDAARLSTLSAHVGHVYVTNEGTPNPYAALPRYLSSLVEGLQSNNTGALVRPAQDHPSEECFRGVIY